MAPATSLHIRNPFQLSDFATDKVVEVDILYHDATGREVQLDVQVAPHDGMQQRMLHYWAQLYSNQTGRGQEYRRHQPLVAVWLFDQQLFRATPTAWFHHFMPTCSETGILLHEDLRIITIEMAVWRKQILANLPVPAGSSILEGVERWLYFLDQAPKTEAQTLTATLPEPMWQEALKIMTEFASDDQMQIYYRQRDNLERTIASYIGTGYTKGRLELSQEILDRLIASGVSKEDAARLVGIDTPTK